MIKHLKPAAFGAVFVFLCTALPVCAGEMYPVSVTTGFENGKPLIVKVYELKSGEDPALIPAEPFEKDGYAYELSDILKEAIVSEESLDYQEIIPVETPTNDLETILAELESQIEVKTEEGFAGILHLEIASIKPEAAGWKTTSYTAGITREYPNLAANDVSLIPKTISENGRIYTLDTVNWRESNTDYTDGYALPNRYTGVGTFTAQATSKKATGYLTKAVYSGKLYKTNSEVTRYSAFYYGAPAAKEKSGLAALCAFAGGAAVMFFTLMFLAGKKPRVFSSVMPPGGPQLAAVPLQIVPKVKEE